MERNKWLPAKAAKLQVLDKVNGQATVLTVQVGRSAGFGSLTIIVKSCMVRTPDQPADSAGYLNVTDSHSDSMRLCRLAAGERAIRVDDAAPNLRYPCYRVRLDPWTSLPPFHRTALMLDMDGTLIDLALTPDSRDRPRRVCQRLLRRSVDMLDGALAIVTGRPVETVDQLFSDAHLVPSPASMAAPSGLPSLNEDRATRLARAACIMASHG